MKNNKYQKYLNEFLKVMGILSMVTVIWQLLEMIIFKKITPNKVDNIIAVILTCSLYLNLKTFNKKLGSK